ncbi:MAG TPA: biotin/lipoyl-binding protein [Actinomycetospora sp.]|uniref:efflux RND transporter periplasmic adaptor subunit n=1 Tax=Actinomycetospora sp. TaxID=1872135 RepID=UPI002F423D09
MSTGVDSTGSVSSVGSTNLGFPTGGQLTSVRVKVGDLVHAGQVLATIDDFAARRALQQARAQLAGQQAQYDKVADAPSVQGAQSSVNAAASIVSATKRQVDATLAADDAAVAAAGQGASGATPMTGEDATGATAGVVTAAGSTAAGAASGLAAGAMAAGGSALTAAGSTGGAAGPAGAGGASGAQTLAQATAKRQADAAAGQVQIANARQGQVTAQNSLDSASAARPNDLAAARAAVDAARSQVLVAQQNLANTTLRAPADGTITALNGVVGEFVAASGSTTPAAPGTDAAIPGAAQAANAAAGAAGAAAGASPTRPGGTQFLVLQNLTQFAVVVPFQEIDAAKIAPQQHVSVSLDAIPDGTLDGTVLAVAPSATALSGSIEYYVTIGLPADPRVHDGQSARATVITSQSGPTISVPNGALHRQPNGTSVTVVTPDGRQVPTPVTTGVAGPDRTEITGGLAEGQQVVVGGGR